MVARHAIEHGMRGALQRLQRERPPDQRPFAAEPRFGATRVAYAPTLYRRRAAGLPPESAKSGP